MGDVELSGPIFRVGYFGPMTEEVRDEVAAQGLAYVHRNLDLSIQHPTPYYETQIANELDGADRVIHDRGVIYGPWLEGTSGRNLTTSFRGYHSFRRARESLGLVTQRLADAVARRWTS